MSTRISVTFDDDVYRQLKLIADKNGDSAASVVRELVQRSLDGELTAANLTFITSIMREQLKDVIQPFIERLAALNAKTGVQAGAAAYLAAEAIAKFVPDNMQAEVTETYEQARKKAVAYIQRRGDLS